MWNLSFPAPGDYTIRIMVDGSERKRLPLVVEQRKMTAGAGAPRQAERAALPAADRPGLGRARVQSTNRHPIPDRPVRRAGLRRRDGRHGDRVGHDPAPSELILPFASFLVSDAGGGRAADRGALGLLVVVIWRPSATRSATLIGYAMGRGSAGRSWSATGGTCSSASTRSSWPTISSRSTARRPPSSPAAALRAHVLSFPAGWRACT